MTEPADDDIVFVGLGIHRKLNIKKELLGDTFQTGDVGLRWRNEERAASRRYHRLQNNSKSQKMFWENKWRWP